MTLGEKIRQARKRIGLSQEQLAQKLCVSRSAVAKWETGKGMPDIENLKMLSRLFGVSVDSLISDGDAGDIAVVREHYNLAAYGRGCKKVKKDRMMLEKFPGAKITTLLGRPDLTKGEKIIDNTLGFLTSAPFGMPEFINGVKNLDKEFYLVEQGEDQFFVTVTDEFLEIRRMEPKVTKDQFKLENWNFIRCAYDVK